MQRLLSALVFAAACLSAQSPQQQQLAALKQAVAENQAALKKFQWTEHTEISLKGEVKSTKDELCRYGPDGKVQKTELSPPPPPPSGGRRGLKGKIVEKKKDELEDYMQRAVTLIKDYLPPDPQKLQALTQDGNVTVGEAGPGAVKVEIKNYWKMGDVVTFTFNSAAKAVTAIAINTYLDEKDPITLQVNFETLPDGTNHVAVTNLDAPGKKVGIRVQSANYQRIGA